MLAKKVSNRWRLREGPRKTLGQYQHRAFRVQKRWVERARGKTALSPISPDKAASRRASSLGVHENSYCLLMGLRLGMETWLVSYCVCKIYVHVCLCTWMYVCTYVHACMCLCVYVTALYFLACMYMYAHTRLYMYVYIEWGWREAVFCQRWSSTRGKIACFSLPTTFSLSFFLLHRGGERKK